MNTHWYIYRNCGVNDLTHRHKYIKLHYYLYIELNSIYIAHMKWSTNAKQKLLLFLCSFNLNVSFFMYVKNEIYFVCLYINVKGVWKLLCFIENSRVYTFTHTFSNNNYRCWIMHSINEYALVYNIAIILFYLKLHNLF